MDRLMMHINKLSKLAAGIALVTFGTGVLASGPSQITGAIVGVNSDIASPISTFLGFFLVACGILVLATAPSQGLEKKIALSSAIKKDKGLLRLVEDAVRNEDVQRGLNHLIAELGKGNYEAGLGTPGHIEGTDIFYMREKNGDMLFYHQIGPNQYEIVGKASKANEQQVIDELRKTHLKDKYHPKDMYSK